MARLQLLSVLEADIDDLNGDAPTPGGGRARAMRRGRSAGGCIRIVGRNWVVHDNGGLAGPSGLSESVSAGLRTLRRILALD